MTTALTQISGDSASRGLRSHYFPFSQPATLPSRPWRARPLCAPPDVPTLDHAIADHLLYPLDLRPNSMIGEQNGEKSLRTERRCR